MSKASKALWRDRDSQTAGPLPVGYDDTVAREADVTTIRTHAVSAQDYWNLIMNLGIGGFVSSITAGTIVLASLGPGLALYSAAIIAGFALLWYGAYGVRASFVQKVAACDGRLKQLEETVEKLRRVRNEHRDQLEREVLARLEDDLPRHTDLATNQFSLARENPPMRNPDPYSKWQLGKAAVDDWGFKMSFYNPHPGISLYPEGRRGLWKDALVHYPKLSLLNDLETALKSFHARLAALDTEIAKMVPDERTVDPGWGLAAAKQLFAIWLLSEGVLQHGSNAYSLSTDLREKAAEFAKAKLDVKKARALAIEIQELARKIDASSANLMEAVRIYRCYPTLDEDCAFTKAPDLRNLVESATGQ